MKEISVYSGKVFIIDDQGVLVITLNVVGYFCMSVCSQ